MPYVEILKESRAFSETSSTNEQTLVYVVALEDFDSIAIATLDATFGSFFAPNSDVAVVNYIAATFPLSRKFKSIAGTTITLFLMDVSVEEIQQDMWRITLKYTIPRDQGQSSGTYVQFGFQVGNNTEHITRAQSTISSASRTGSSLTPPDTKSCIGVTKNGIEGIDVPARGLRFNITNYFSPTIWDTSFLTTFNGLATCYNNATFFGFSAGEVLFLGCDGQGDAYRLVPIKFDFLAKPNISGATDPGFGTLTMLGHDILDYLYIQETSNDYQISAPFYRYVHRHFQPANFTLLGF